VGRLTECTVHWTGTSAVFWANSKVKPSGLLRSLIMHSTGKDHAGICYLHLLLYALDVPSTFVPKGAGACLYF